jgi:hypothetical protein
MKRLRCAECGAGYESGLTRCPLCGADTGRGKAKPKLEPTADVDRYQSDLRRLRKQLRKLRNA